ncbi:MAG TPA: RelA/SpoT domain-containing protein [Solirubrobacterales bacterium]
MLLVRYSKTQVNRSGKLLAEQMRIAILDTGHPDLDPAALAQAIEVVEWWRSEHSRPLSRVATNLRNYAAEEGPPVVAQRLKRLPTIAGKLLREPKMNLARMADIGGARAVVSDQASAFRIAQRLERNWTITRVHDYVTHPKSDGYRALHLINRHRGRLIEIQLRTSHQDRWANTVEAFSRTVAPGLKFGGGPAPLREYFRSLGELFAALDVEAPLDPAMLKRVAELASGALSSIQRPE